MRERELFELRAHIGMVFQESALFDSLNVEDNVAYRLHEEHVPEDEVHKRVVEALRVRRAGARPSTSFPRSSPAACAAASRSRAPSSRGPDLILYDSPTGGLDPITSTTIIELVMKQRDVSHTTSLLVTHRLQDAFVLATHRYRRKAGNVSPSPRTGRTSGIDPGTKFLILNDTRIIFNGATEELVHSEDPWIKGFLA